MNYSNKYSSTTALKDNTQLKQSLETLVSFGYNKIELGSTHPFEKKIKKILLPKENNNKNVKFFLLQMESREKIQKKSAAAINFFC